MKIGASTNGSCKALVKVAFSPPRIWVNWKSDIICPIFDPGYFLFGWEDSVISPAEFDRSTL